MSVFSDVMDFLEKMSLKRLGILVVILVILLFLFPIIESNFLYYNRLDSRIEILERMLDIEADKVISNEILKEEYYSILEEIDSHKVYSSNILASETTKEVKMWKFISGSILGIIIIFCIPFIYKSFKEAVSGFFALLLIAATLGFVGLIIPTFSNPYINYIGWPVTQLVLTIIGLIAYSKKDKKAKNI